MARLNGEQKAAAAHRGGHAIVLAGPGTGKTTTLTARHSFLRSTGKDPSGIMVVTFTQKAAMELRTRLGPHAPSDAWIGTFHGICNRILKRFHAQAGLRRNFRILDPGGQRLLLNDLGIRWEADDGDLTDIIGRWKDSLIEPDEAAARVGGMGDGNIKLRMAAEHYAVYEEELARRGDLDFADLMKRSLELLRGNDEVKAFFRTRVSDVLVDEFQDVNRVQVELLTSLAVAGSTIWAVADDDQALYGWRGGDVKLTVNFADRFPGAQSYTLSENYRCDPAIIAAANTLIACNRTRVRKALRATRQHTPGNVVRLRGFRTEREEAEWITTELKRRIQDGMSPSDACILFRTASVTPAVQQALENADIPFDLSGTPNFWEMPEVVAVADLLLEVASGTDGQMAMKSRAARDLVSTMPGSPPAEAAVAAGRIVSEMPPPGCTGERAALWSDNAEAAAEIARTHRDAESFMSHVRDMASRGAADGADAVSLSTIHSSKGLEWGYVVIAGCEASLMPHHRNRDHEEERRLLYVAVTRSKGSVDLTHSRMRFGRSQQPSVFLGEIAKAPRGAVIWSGDQPAQNPQSPHAKRGQAAGGSSALAQGARTSPAGITTYRKRGGRSLIPPGEE